MLEVQAEQLKPLLKEVVRELLLQERDLLTELVFEVMEDVAMARAIDEGKDTDNVERSEIFELLRQ